MTVFDADSRAHLPSNLLNDLTNEGGPLGEVSLAAGDLGLGLPGGELVVALVQAIGETYCSILISVRNPPKSYLVVGRAGGESFASNVPVFSAAIAAVVSGAEMGRFVRSSSSGGRLRSLGSSGDGALCGISNPVWEVLARS